MAAKRVLYFDVLNVVACLGVVAMHFNGLTWAWSPTLSWLQAFSVDCLFYWAVPIFFMLTGATLMGYREKYDTKTFFAKRVARTFVPFLAWSLGALVWQVATGQYTDHLGPRTLLDLVFNAKIIDVYWFFIPLFSVYLALPVLSLLKDNRQALWYMAFGASALTVFLPRLFSLAGVEWNSNASFPAASSYLVYVLLGYLLSTQEIPRGTRRAVYVLGVAGVAVRLVATIVLSGAEQGLSNGTWGYLNIPCFLQSVAVFVFAKSVRWEGLFSSARAKGALARIAGCSFGIYLMHKVAFWYVIQLTGLNGGDWEFRVLAPLACYALCLALTLGLKRIPVLRRAVP